MAKRRRRKWVSSRSVSIPLKPLSYRLRLEITADSRESLLKALLEAEDAVAAGKCRVGRDSVDRGWMMRVTETILIAESKNGT